MPCVNQEKMLNTETILTSNGHFSSKRVQSSRQVNGDTTPYYMEETWRKDTGPPGGKIPRAPGEKIVTPMT